MTTPMPKFEIYKDTAGKFRWRLKAPNGEIIAVSEAYESKDGCNNGINSVKMNAPKAEIKDLAM
ncbi:MAG: YegP family protein [Candidatus Bathyarchaeota archaeon]|nr:YegP family protein [Candidatus Bathyarchaeota archaeon]MDH5787119.1 YegP family protein [Candidatus Bathyarchaeota archaeon]